MTQTLWYNALDLTQFYLFVVYATAIFDYNIKATTDQLATDVTKRILICEQCMCLMSSKRTKVDSAKYFYETLIIGSSFSTH